MQSTTRMIELTDEAAAPAGGLQQDLAGKEVFVTLKNTGAAQNAVLSGTLWEIPPHPTTRSWDTEYSSLNPNSSSYYLSRGQPSITPAMPATGDFLTLLENAADTEIQLISGYPNVRFGRVDSPLWPRTGLAAFFQQIHQSGPAAGGITSNAISQQMIYSNGSSRDESTPLPEVAEQGNISDDIHYESIGKHSLKAGDSLSLDLAAASAAYERVVEWVVPDPRDGNGREPTPDEPPWDAVRIANPFKFPLTTAAAMVMEGGKPPSAFLISASTFRAQALLTLAWKVFSLTWRSSSAACFYLRSSPAWRSPSRKKSRVRRCSIFSSASSPIRSSHGLRRCPNTATATIGFGE